MLSTQLIDSKYENSLKFLGNFLMFYVFRAMKRQLEDISSLVREKFPAATTKRAIMHRRERELKGPEALSAEQMNIEGKYRNFSENSHVNPSSSTCQSPHKKLKPEIRLSQ